MRVNRPGRKAAMPGACGHHSLTRHGAQRPLAAKVSLPLEPGDVLTIQTPGGGGYGVPQETS